MSTTNTAARYSPFLAYKSAITQTWATTGNTDTVTNANVHSNSVVIPVPTSQQNGLWYVTVTEGQFVVTSSDSESAGLTYTYIVL